MERFSITRNARLRPFPRSPGAHRDGQVTHLLGLLLGRRMLGAVVMLDNGHAAARVVVVARVLAVTEQARDIAERHAELAGDLDGDLPAELPQLGLDLGGLEREGEAFPYRGAPLDLRGPLPDLLLPARARGLLR